MNFYVIAGEASGDLHASNLMKELKKLDPAVTFRCWGGDLMEAQGGEIVKHYRELAFMGFTEVLLNMRTILKNIAFCKEDILSHRPDALILVDYPGFNLRIAEFAKKSGIKVFYYISPQVWAWKRSRVHRIKRTVDRMFVILPFEKDFYLQFGCEVDFVGHPLLDAIGQRTAVPVEGFKKKNALDQRPIIALLPGSRRQEISMMLPVMLNIRKDFPGYQFVVSGAPSVPEDLYRSFLPEDVPLVKDQTYDLVSSSFAALVTSGTATLETALLGTPEVVCYKGGAISFQIAKRVVNVKYISLVNLIMDREVVKELIQNELTRENLAAELRRIISDVTVRGEMLRSLAELRTKLGGPGASATTARLMMSHMQP